MAGAEVLLSELGKVGVEPADAHQLFRVMQALTIGAAMMAGARPSGEEISSRAGSIVDLKERFPNLTEALPSVSTSAPDTDFELGVDLLVAAMREQISD